MSAEADIEGMPWNQPVIDHCVRCGGEFPPQAADVCPKCKPGPGLIRTWGERQAERMRSGTRHDESGVFDPADDGPQPVPTPATGTGETQR